MRQDARPCHELVSEGDARGSRKDVDGGVCRPPAPSHGWRPRRYNGGMPFVSVTRLRLRSVRFLPSFALHTLRSLRQIQTAAGFKAGSLLLDRRWTFWTATLWDAEESMRQYRNTAAHKAAMPYLLQWCDEASLVHWTQEAEDVPPWTEADRRMRESGRISKVRFPSPHHADRTYRAPRTSAAGPIRAARPRNG